MGTTPHTFLNNIFTEGVKLIIRNQDKAQEVIAALHKCVGGLNDESAKNLLKSLETHSPLIITFINHFVGRNQDQNAFNFAYLQIAKPFMVDRSEPKACDLKRGSVFRNYPWMWDN